MDASISWEEDDMNKTTARRKRHRANAKLQFGKKAVREHREISGRTGQVFSKKTKSSKALKFVKSLVNFPFPFRLEGNQ